MNFQLTYLAAFLTRNVRESLRFGSGPFPPCACGNSLLEAVSHGAEISALGHLNLTVPACFSFDHSRNYPQTGKFLFSEVRALARTTNGVVARYIHNIRRLGEGGGRLLFS